MASNRSRIRQLVTLPHARATLIVMVAILMLGAAYVGLVPHLAGASPAPHGQRMHAHNLALGTPDGVAVYRPSNNTFYFRNMPTTGFATSYLVFGMPSDLPVVGNWAGDGIDRPAVYRPSTGIWYVQTLNASRQPVTLVFNYPAYGSGFVPMAGDWSGRGSDGIGVFILNNFPGNNVPLWYFKYALPTTYYSEPDCVFLFGAAGDIPLFGDWTGSGKVGIGAYRPSTSTFYLINDVTTHCDDITPPASVDEVVTYGQPGDIPFAGDWTGSGKDGLGVYRPSVGTMYFRNDATTTGFADSYAVYGLSGDIPLAGHWG